MGHDLPPVMTHRLSMTRHTHEAHNDMNIDLGDSRAVIGAFSGIIITHVICTVFLVLRIASRLHCLRRWFVDDTLMVISWIWSTGICTVYSLALHLPSPIDVMHKSPMVTYLLRTYLGLILYQLALCFAKLSIGSFYLRMFKSKPAMTALTWTTIGLIIGLAIPLTAMSALQCYPGDGQVLGQPMACLGFTPLLIVSSSTHTATDAWLIIMILPTISKLGLPLRRKIAISAILSLGIFEMAASMIRLQLSLHKDFNPSGGNQAANTLAFFCTTVLECDTAIICASVPMVRPIMSKIWPSMFPEPRHSAGSFNLTVVSFHGYPWQDQPASPRNRHSSSNNNNISSPKMADTRRSSANKAKGPSNTLSPEDALKISASASGAPIATPDSNRGSRQSTRRTPTPLSLKSFMNSPRPHQGLGLTGPDTKPILSTHSEDSLGELTRYSDNFRRWGTPDLSLTLGGKDPQSLWGGGSPHLQQQRSSFGRRESGQSSVGGGGGGGTPTVRFVRRPFRGSQESFMSPSDPASPRTLIPSLGSGHELYGARWQSIDLGTRPERPWATDGRPATRD
ncbi:integral membrane protein [Apiospora arundinis]|uniref:Integral membrane protein n=1 Tax=Apiospora arundinis TaxID=335852 RepID=A0ABR2I058_9PEZI